jgi:hypothetical protein
MSVNKKTGSYVLFYCIFNLRMVPRTLMQAQSRSKLMPAMYYA